MDEATFTVPELAGALRGLVQLGFPDEVWVEGEIGAINRTAAGHVFLDLVEPGPAGSPPVALLPVALWREARRAVNDALRAHGAVRMTEGVRIRIRGRLDLYPRSGRVQLHMTAIDPDFTVGRLAMERLRLLRALADEGLLERNRAVPLPALPTRVGLVTSVGSAAHADVLAELRASGLGLTVLEADTAVQGVGAERRIVAALASVVSAGAEVVLVVRGGGARTDLAAFDAEVVARAVAELPVPVLTGVGHEVDDTVIDAVAHRAFKTPTACAAGLVGHLRATVAHLDGLADAVARAAPAALARAAHHVAATTARLERQAGAAVQRAERDLDRRAHGVVVGARRQLRGAERRVAHLAGDVARGPDRALADADRRLAVAAARTSAVDPARALARGWSITRTADGRLVRDPSALAPGTPLVTTVAEGTVHSSVVAVGDRDGEVDGG